MTIGGLSGKPKVGNFYLFIFYENIGRFDITMQKIFTSEIDAARDNLFGEGDNFFWVSFKEMLSNVLFKVFFAKLKEEVEIICGFFDVFKLDNVGMF